MTSNNSRPLIPVNPQGLDEIAKALLEGAPKRDLEETLGDLPDIVMRNPRNYISVPEKKIVIATRQAYDFLIWDDAIRIVGNDNLRITPVESFMSHFLNLREASQGRKQLVYADGTPVSKNDAIQHWNYVSSTDRSAFENKQFWTWLDALFKQTPQGMEMETDHRFNGSKLESRIVKLDAYAPNNNWADLTLNAQGLPKTNNGTSYVQGQNIYFWAPVDGRVAGFYAVSDRALLGCNWVPADRNSGLGVLACAAGGTPKNLGDKK